MPTPTTKGIKKIPTSKEGVIELGEVHLKFKSAKTLLAHQRSLIEITRKHIAAMKAEIAGLDDVTSISGSKPKFDIYI